MSNGSKFFSVMVIGDEPETMMEKYNIDLEVERYLKYKYLDAEKMQKNSIKILTEMVKNPRNFNLTSFHVDYLKNRLKEFEKMSSFEYYTTVTYGLYYDENGDAWDNKNPNGKWKTFRIGKNFAIPLKLLNGEETYTAFNKDIDWENMHMVNTHVYETVWELIKEGREAKTDEELVLFNNMKDKDNYFANFKNKDEYVIHNCAYWNYAVLNQNGWFDIDDSNKEMEWISTFFDKFIVDLKPTDKITIFECTRDKEETMF